MVSLGLFLCSVLLTAMADVVGQVLRPKKAGGEQAVPLLLGLGLLMSM